MKHLMRTLVGVISLGLGLAVLSPNAHAITVKTAAIKAGAVYVSGTKATASAQILWQGQVVGVAKPNGSFSFSTTILPPTCVGKLSDGVSTIDVVVQSCGPVGAVGPQGPQGNPGPKGDVGPAGAPLPVVVVDSSQPPQTLGAAYGVWDEGAFITFVFEGKGYPLDTTIDGYIRSHHGDKLWFPNSTCTPPGYLQAGYLNWTPINNYAIVFHTTAGQELWVQDGAAVPGFVALSSMAENQRDFCTTTNFNLGRDGAVPMRKTGIIFERDYPPPYKIVNWPTLP